MSGSLYEASFESEIDGPLEALYQSAVGAARLHGAKKLRVTVSAKIRDEEPDTYGWMPSAPVTHNDAVTTNILKALDAAHGNKTEAAKILGLKRTTLVEKMKRLGMM